MQSTWVRPPETSLYFRGREHAWNYDMGGQESFMVKHQHERHGGMPADFKARVKSSFQDCLSRQVAAEGFYIRRSEQEVLNSKSEWHQPVIWRVASELIRECNLCGMGGALLWTTLH